MLSLYLFILIIIYAKYFISKVLIMVILKNILYLAKINNITERNLCKIINMSSSIFSSWKNGKGGPSAEHLRILADFFNVSADYLCELTDISSPIKRLNLSQESLEELNRFIDLLKQKDMMLQNEEAMLSAGRAN